MRCLQARTSHSVGCDGTSEARRDFAPLDVQSTVKSCWKAVTCLFCLQEPEQVLTANRSLSFFRWSFVAFSIRQIEGYCSIMFEASSLWNQEHRNAISLHP